MKAQKRRYTINAIALLIYKIEEKQAKKNLVVALFINMKGIFDQVSKI